MADKAKGALSGAAGGAATGAAIGGPYGAVIGGVAGGLYGLFSTPDDYISPSFSDINLQSENPELYAQLLKLRAVEALAKQEYDTRRQGATYQEEQDYARGLSNSRDIQASQGLLGTSVGNSQMTATNNQLRGAIAERALREKEALYNNYQQAAMQNFNATRQGLMDVMGQRTGAAEMNYKNGLAEQEGNNQFIYNGLRAYQTADQNQANLAYQQQLQQNSPFGQGYGTYGYGASIPQANYEMPTMNPYSQGVPGMSQPQYGLGGNYRY